MAPAQRLAMTQLATALFNVCREMAFDVVQVDR